MRPVFLGSLAAVALAALSACGHSPATTFLTIDPAPPVAAGEATHAVRYAGPPLRVPFLHVPLTIDRPEFAREVAGTLKVSDFDRWAAPLGLLARNTLIQDLQRRLPSGAVLAPDAAAVTPELLVEPTVTRFHVNGGEAVMDLSYRLVHPAANHPAPPELVTLRAAVSADTAPAQAAAWSALLGQFADRIAGEVSSVPPR